MPRLAPDSIFSGGQRVSRTYVKHAPLNPGLESTRF